MRVNTHRARGLFLAWVCGGLLWCVPAVQAQPLTLETMLIHASDRPAALDRRLDKVEFRLRRVFGFEHYAFLSERTLAISLPSTTTIDVGAGYDLRVDVRSQKGRIHAELEWMRDKTVLLRTGLSVQRGKPTILGGPNYKEGTLILVLEFK